MSNFFAALDDSDTERKAPTPTVNKKKQAPKKTVVEPSKVEKRPPKKEDRHTKGGRGSRPAARDGKRTHDRRSGTGRGREVKKGGGGGRNWGSDQNDARKAEGPVTEGKEDVNTPESEEAAEKEEEAVEEKEPEPEEITMSYDEYMAQKAKPDSEAFKALESREVDNEFAGKAAAKKEEADFLVMGGGKGLRKKGAGKKEKEKLVLDFKVKSAISDDRGGDKRRDGRRDGGRRDGGNRNRDGRRSDRGSRGKGKGRGGSSRGVDTTSNDAFPSL